MGEIFWSRLVGDQVAVLAGAGEGVVAATVDVVVAGPGVQDVAAAIALLVVAWARTLGQTRCGPGPPGHAARPQSPRTTWSAVGAKRSSQVSPGFAVREDPSAERIRGVVVARQSYYW